MLEKLNTINWNEIESAFGTGEEIPQLLMELASDKPDVTKNAFIELQELISHQGSIYEATSYTIPFLFELLSTSNNKEAQGLISELLVNPLPSYERWSKINSLNWTQNAQPTWTALTEGYNVLIEILNTGSQQAQINAVHILTFICVFHIDKAPTILTSLIHILNRTNTDEMLKAIIIYDLGELYEAIKDKMILEKEQLINLFRIYWKPTSLSPMNFAYSLSVCKLMGIQTPQEVENYLIDAISDPIWNPDLLKKGIYMAESIVVGVGGMDTNAITALWNLGLNRSIQAISKVLERIQSPKRARKIGVILLDWVFYREPLSLRTRPRLGVYRQANQALDVSKLEKYHKQALLAVIDSDTVWKEQTNLLEIYGLPADRDKVRQLLAE